MKVENIAQLMSCFQDTDQRLMAQAIKRSKHAHWPPPVSRQTTLGSLSSTPLMCWYWLLSQLLKVLHEISESPERDCVTMLLQLSTDSTGVRFGDREDHATPLDMCTFLDIAFNQWLVLSQVTEFGRAESTTFASQLEAQLQRSPAEQFHKIKIPLGSQSIS